MSAKERLQRLRNLREMASNLYKSIIAECDIAQAEVAAIDKQIAESEKRCEAFEQMATWDGKQPDTWVINGRVWRKPTSKDRGKMVRVSNRQECDPSEMEEAKLIGHSNSFWCEGTRYQVVFWKYAWIESNPCEEDRNEEAQDDGKGYISIQVGSFYPGEPSLPVVKEDLKTKPPFKKFDLVVVREPKLHDGPPHLLWLREMNRYDDTVKRVSFVHEEEEYCTLQDCYGDEGAYRFAFSWLKKIEG